ncbi:hypothetical protein NKG94_48670 [Micromonospora sp. M12]
MRERRAWEMRWRRVGGFAHDERVIEAYRTQPTVGTATGLPRQCRLPGVASTRHRRP